MLEFDIDGQEGILFWILDPATDEGVAVRKEDLDNLKGFLAQHFDSTGAPGATPMSARDFADILDGCLMRVADATMTPADFVDFVASWVTTIRKEV